MAKRTSNEINRRLVAQTFASLDAIELLILDTWQPIEFEFFSAIRPLRQWTSYSDRKQIEIDGKLTAFAPRRSQTPSGVGGSSPPIPEVASIVHHASVLQRHGGFFRSCDQSVKLLKQVRSTGHATDEDLKKGVEARANLFASIAKGVEFVEACVKFFDPENLASFSRWYKIEKRLKPPVLKISRSGVLSLSEPDAPLKIETHKISSQVPSSRELLAYIR